MKTTLITSLIALTLLPIGTIAKTSDHDLQQAVLTTHNALRAKHEAPPLQWDSTLAEFAYQHADRCEFKHTHGAYGENLAAGYPSAEDAINAWYDELRYYSYNNPKFSMATGHFTQLVWKSTRKIGCALIPCNGEHGTPGEYLVCEYSPPGNRIDPGYFADNVMPPINEPQSARS